MNSKSVSACTPKACPSLKSQSIINSGGSGSQETLASSNPRGCACTLLAASADRISASKRPNKFTVSKDACIAYETYCKCDRMQENVKTYRFGSEKGF